MTTEGYTPTLEDYTRDAGDQLWMFWTIALQENGRSLAYKVKKLFNEMYGRKKFTGYGTQIFTHEFIGDIHNGKEKDN